jgi:hypothetical protein
MRLRRLAVVGTSAVATLALLQTPADAWVDACRTIVTLHPDGKSTEVEVCVDVNGTYRRAYLTAYQNGWSSITVNVSSLYLRQCDGYGSNCVLIAQNSGVVTGGGSAIFRGDFKPYSYGHTYLACVSATVNGYSYVNVCSNYRVN